MTEKAKRPACVERVGWKRGQHHPEQSCGEPARFRLTPKNNIHSLAPRDLCEQHFNAYRTSFMTFGIAQGTKTFDEGFVVELLS